MVVTIGSDPYEGEARRRLPTAHDMAAAIRGGDTVTRIARDHQVGVGWAREQLRRAGFDSATGAARSATDAPAPASAPALRPLIGPRSIDLAGLWSRSLVEGALCRSEDPELFFTEGSAPAAIAVCRECAVRVECLEVALAQPSSAQHGVWGGTTPETQAKLQRRDRRSGVAS